MPVVETDPDQREDARRVADEPGVAIVARCAGLSGKFAIEAQRSCLRCRPIVEHVLEHVVHHVADAGRRHAFHLHFPALEKLSFPRGDGEDGNRLGLHSEIREGGVRICDLQRRDFE